MTNPATATGGANPPRACALAIHDRQTVDAICDGWDEDAEAYAFRTKADAPEIDGVTYVDSEDEIAEGTIAKLEILGGEGHEMVGALVE
ncbi:MAG: hypothetical protein IPL62_19795 [Caulobacteraceae bacterium]|nr:hypothetical protein [Caulobacteraceae bacterium]